MERGRARSLLDLLGHSARWADSASISAIHADWQHAEQAALAADRELKQRLAPYVQQVLAVTLAEAEAGMNVLTLEELFALRNELVSGFGDVGSATLRAVIDPLIEEAIRLRDQVEQLYRQLTILRDEERPPVAATIPPPEQLQAQLCALVQGAETQTNVRDRTLLVELPATPTRIGVPCFSCRCGLTITEA